MRKFEDYIKENTLKDDSGEEFELTEDSLKQYYNEFNKKYFNNVLPSVKLELTTLKKAENKYAIGDTKFNVDVINDTVNITKIIINSNRIHSFKGFRNTLVHEMIHYWVILNYPPNKFLWKKYHEFEQKEQTNNLFEYKAKMYEILHLTGEKSHEGKWEDMAKDLNNKFEELNITAKGNQDETLEKGFLENYLNTYTLFLQKKYDSKCIHVVITDSSKYKEIMEAIKLGETIFKEREGKWYKLIVDKDSIKFEKFIVKLNLFDVQTFKNTHDIEMLEDLGLYNEEFLGKIEYKTSMNEQTKTKEELDLLRKEILTWEFSIENDY